MRFLADMGVDVRIAQWLRQQAHDAKHLRDEGLHRSPNGEIFAKAVAEDRVILTFDLDFGESPLWPEDARQASSFSGSTTRGLLT